MTHEIKIGGAWPQSVFYIETDCTFIDADFSKGYCPCKHMVDRTLKAVVVGYADQNETTGICLECIIEAAEDIKLICLK